MKSRHSVILVDSTSHALRIEKALEMEGIASKLIPVPRRLSSDCGVCVRIASEDAAQTRRIMEENGIRFQSIEEL